MGLLVETMSGISVSALLAVALGALSCQTFKGSCFGFGGSSTAFTVIASIA
jgi:hypothetical protein